MLNENWFYLHLRTTLRFIFYIKPYVSYLHSKCKSLGYILFLILLSVHAVMVNKNNLLVKLFEPERVSVLVDFTQSFIILAG